MKLNEIVLLIKNESDEIKLNNLKNELLILEEESIKEVVDEYLGRGMGFDDLFQEACLETLVALENFNMNKSSDFKSFYLRHIKNRINEIVKEEERLRLNNESLVKDLNDLIDSERKLKALLKRNPSHKELMDDLEISHDRLHELYDFAFEALREEDEKLSYSEGLLISDVIDSLGDNSRAEELEESKELVETSLDVLNENERNIITLLFGLDGNEPKTLEEVAKIYHVSPERIRQIRDLSIRRMKNFGE